MSRHPLIAATLVALATMPAAPSFAQEADGERVNQLIVYGDDPCPPSSGNEITVCARKAESERYRIPEPLRGVGSPANDAWVNRVVAYETVGKTGTMSCSPVGPGGSTGCVQKMIDNAYAERASDPSVRFGELIAAERERRLATIDAEARETQERVEEAEREYAVRQAAERAAEARISAAQPSPDGD